MEIRWSFVFSPVRFNMGDVRVWVEAEMGGSVVSERRLLL